MIIDIIIIGYFKKYYGKIDTPGSEKPLRVAICGNAAGSFLTPCILLLNNQQEPVVRDFSAFTALAKKQLAPLITAQKVNPKHFRLSK